MKRTLGIAGAMLLFVMSLSSGCGSSSSSGGAPSDTSTLGSLSDAQVGAFCDELAGIAGGYNKQKMITCNDDAGGSTTVTLSFDIGANQAECKARFRAELPAACKPLTVGSVKTCVTDSYNLTCATADQDVASCDAFFACLGV
jgi:hypothetical protein